MRSRRRQRAQRAQAAQTLQHVIATAGLLAAAAGTLSSGDAHGFELGLAVAEIITSVFLIVTFTWSVRRLVAKRSSHDASAHGTHARDGIDWLDVWAAGVLFVESAEKYHTRGKIWTPSLMTGIATLGLALFHEQLASRREPQRSLRLTDEQLIVGARLPFNTFKVAWRDVAAITMGDREAEIRTRNGRTRQINLADLENADEVREALATARRRVEATAL